jgi:RNA polymerase sigma-70 factor (ECF subfamily)
MTAARIAAERAARESYGRLLAYLCARTRDIAAAEDALGDAFAAALQSWPQTGPPQSPDAWLLTTARRKLIDRARRARTASEAAPEIARALEAAAAEAERPMIDDERLSLMFACAHPAIDPDIRTALVLQTTLGLDAEIIARAFLVSPAAMAQRLVRAKRKIAVAGIPFEIPETAARGERVRDVLEAIYAAYAVASDAFSDEALYLARLVAALAPEESEAHGLVSLIAFIEARRPAHTDARYTPLDDLDSSLFDRSLIAEGRAALGRSVKAGGPGRYQIEAAIQQAHMARLCEGVDSMPAIVRLYDALLAIAPSTGARVARAAALIAAQRHNEAAEVLGEIDHRGVEDYGPYWATLAHALAGADKEKAALAFDRAIALAPDMPTARFLEERKRLLAANDTA